MKLFETSPVIRLVQFYDWRTASERNRDQARADAVLEANFQQRVAANIERHKVRRAHVVAKIRTERGLL